jgi:hypothetical protein
MILTAQYDAGDVGAVHGVGTDDVAVAVGALVDVGVVVAHDRPGVEIGVQVKLQVGARVVAGAVDVRR